MTNDIVTQGLELMIFGMGTVFCFLTLLVLMTTAMSRILSKLAPEAEVVAAPAVSLPSQGVDPQLLNVLAQAVKQYKDKR